MEVKTDTKEKFHVISVSAINLSANMTEELCIRLNNYLQHEIKNVVLKLNNVKEIDEAGAERLVKMQQKFYESGASFVVCELTPELETFLDDKSLLELMNVTPTESEAWDIIQMEEIERELLSDEDGL
ncbi:MAG: STAS domain-containing protein [Chitinophagaceae bacterium]